MSVRNTGQASLRLRLVPQRVRSAAGGDQKACALRAFTILELLLVVTVIMLLAGLALASMSAARESARRVRCVSNLRQMGIAISSYGDDHGGYPPPFFGGTIVMNGNCPGRHYKIHTQGKWAMAVDIGPISNPALLLCPSDKTPGTISTADLSGNAITVPDSYAYNYEFYMAGLRLTGVDQSQILLLMDGFDGNSLEQGVWGANLCSPSAHSDLSRFNSTIVTRRHSQRFNAVFIDCHVEWLAALATDTLLPGWQ